MSVNRILKRSELTKYLTREDIWMANKHMKKFMGITSHQKI